MNGFAAIRELTPRRCVEWFVVANFAFLGLDIAIAHTQNHFRERVEWSPIVFSAVAVALLLPMVVGVRERWCRRAEVLVAVGSVAVGVLGMVLHLRSAFFVERTLHNLVYSAPFVAPLAYVGVGLLLLLVRLEPTGSPVLGPWILVLTLGGFVGNFGLSLLDHAANAFFRWTEWIPVFASAFASAFLLVGLLRKEPGFALILAGVLVAQAVVGALGFALHVSADLRRPDAILADRFIYGAPLFAPLLFANLALLGVLGLWAEARPEKPEALRDARGSAKEEAAGSRI
jgi:hypothetical protein